MTRIFLVTPGQTNWDIEERLQGNISVPLNAHGVVQIARLAAEKSALKLDAIYSGESRDAVQTAHILAKAWGAKVKRTKELNEVDLGLWQGLHRAEVKRRFGKAYKQWRREPLLVEAARRSPGRSAALDLPAGMIIFSHEITTGEKLQTRRGKR